MGTWTYIFGIAFIVVSVMLVLIVLLQKGRGGGLGAALGGAGGSAFGAKTGDVMTWVTIFLTALFLLLAIVTGYIARPTSIKISTPYLAVGRSIAAPGQVEIPGLASVRVGCETVGCKLKYTLDGSEPNDDSQATSGVLKVKPGQMLKVKAFRKNSTPSDTVVFTFVQKTLPVATPVISPDSGEFEKNKPVKITITCKTEDAKIYFTTDGSEPKSDDPDSSVLYTDSFEIKPDTEIQARAYANDLAPSEIASNKYDIKTIAIVPVPKIVAKPIIAPAGGAIAKPVEVKISCDTPNARIYYTLDGSEPTELSTLYKKTFFAKPGATIKVRGFSALYEPSEITIVEFKKIAAPKPADAPKPTAAPNPADTPASSNAGIALPNAA